MRKTDVGTSPRVGRLILRRAGSITSVYGAKTNLKAKQTLFATSKTNPCVTNGIFIEYLVICFATWL